MNTSLQQIGFYTLSDERAENVSATSPMMRCEMILTNRCNFRCPYCRGLRPDCQGDMPFELAMSTLKGWIADGLQNVRFSGGEPMVYPYLPLLIMEAAKTCKHIAISTNGSFSLYRYQDLIDLGVNDFSISLDACCAAYGDKMAGGVSGSWERVTSNIRELSKLTYVTVGVVLTSENAPHVKDIIEFADSLGVADIRIIPAAQEGNMIEGVEGISQEILDRHPILAYRVSNLLAGKSVRGIKEADCDHCHIVQDDSVACGKFHFPCVIYMREQGEPIGELGPNMRSERIKWFNTHNTQTDEICRKNCLDVCIAHNNKCHSALIRRLV
jgi:molybdenum cofactor biosynthesis enzyme MoaA